MRRNNRWSHRRNRWRRPGRLRWTLGFLASALVLPILLASSTPILAALIPGAFLTMVGVQALDRDAADRGALEAQLVSPTDVAEQHRIHNAAEVPDQSRRL